MMRNFVALFLAAACALSSHAQQSPDSPAIPDFTFVHISDTNVGTRLAGEPEPKEIRGEDTFRWMGEELKKPQKIGGVEVPPPSFVVCTGDITEFGAPGETWSDVIRLFAHLPVPYVMALGEQDNNWVPVSIDGPAFQPEDQDLPKSPSGLVFAFDHGPFHFIALNSASIQGPAPAFAEGDFVWLQSHLKKLPASQPVIVFFHHPPDSAEFAQPWQLGRLMGMLDETNVVLMLYGHDRVPAHTMVQGIDCVEGGTTFATATADDAGYNVVSLKAGILRVIYRYRNGNRPPLMLLEKTLEPPPEKRLFKIYDPEVPSRELDDSEPHREAMRLSIYFDAQPSDGVIPERLRLLIDEKPMSVQWREGSPLSAAHRLGCVNCGRGKPSTPTWQADLLLSGLAPGGHVLTVELPTVGGRALQRSRSVFVIGGPVRALWRKLIETGPGPGGAVIAGKNQIVAAFENGLWFMDRASGESIRDTVHHSPPARGALGVYSEGDDATVVAGLSTGQVLGQLPHVTHWSYEAGARIYAAPLVADGMVYIGDNQGRLHAIDTKTGEARWVFDTHGYSIQAKPCVVKDLLVFGAWDGYVYALKKGDGSLAWKQLGPKSSTGGASARSFAPAACGPVAIGERIFVCDAGYELAWYSLEGEMHKLDIPNVAAIGATDDGSMLMLRGTDDKLTLLSVGANGGANGDAKTGASGEAKVGTKDGGELGARSAASSDVKRVWNSKVALGRFPVPPIEKNGVIYVCSDRGLVSWVDVRDGKVLATYQATRGAYVFAPLAVDGEGVCYVSGMDASLTALSFHATGDKSLQQK